MHESLGLFDGTNLLWDDVAFVDERVPTQVVGM
jgi:hypothetical protein